MAARMVSLWAASMPSTSRVGSASAYPSRWASASTSANTRPRSRISVRMKLLVPLMIPASHSMRFAASPSRTRPLSRHRNAAEDRPAGALRADRANPGGGPDPACRGSPQPGRPASFRAEHAAHHTSRPGSTPGSSSSRPRSLGWIRITTVGKTRRSGPSRGPRPTPPGQAGRSSLPRTPPEVSSLDSQARTLSNAPSWRSSLSASSL